jgi:hypothetical protein
MICLDKRIKFPGDFAQLGNSDTFYVLNLSPLWQPESIMTGLKRGIFHVYQP